ncbi:MAG TPA: RNA polymerase sigma factor [Rhizomicrobium sp.]|jgi:RNA polymerase sigma-70 factor (ECF subfamily)|nr:RNA polymerase sigma factor [Rhizomicrobium sp.]
MTGRSEDQRGESGARLFGEPMNASELKLWFAQEVLPLEAALMQFLQHNWRNQSDIADLRQEVYVRVCEAAREAQPDNTKAFVFRTARNILINRVRREHVVPIEAVADVDALNLAADEPSPDRTVIARDELRRLQSALDRLPERCREAVILGRIEGLSGREIAERMGITESTVSIHLANGVRALVDAFFAPLADRRGKP